MKDHTLGFAIQPSLVCTSIYVTLSTRTLVRSLAVRTDLYTWVGIAFIHICGVKWQEEIVLVKKKKKKKTEQIQTNKKQNKYKQTNWKIWSCHGWMARTTVSQTDFCLWHMPSLAAKHFMWFLTNDLMHFHCIFSFLTQYFFIIRTRSTTALISESKYD